MRRLPLTRRDCVNGPRPCPHVTCEHHLHTDTGELLPSEETCTLDVADRGEKTLDEVAEVMGYASRESIRQIEEAALRKIRNAYAGKRLQPLAVQPAPRMSSLNGKTPERARHEAARALADHVEWYGDLEPVNRHLGKVRRSRVVSELPDESEDFGEGDDDSAEARFLALVWRAYTRRTNHAPEERQVEQDDLSQHPDGAPSGPTLEAGDCDRRAQGGQASPELEGSVIQLSFYLGVELDEVAFG